MWISGILLYFRISVSLYLGTYILYLDANTCSFFTMVLMEKYGQFD